MLATPTVLAVLVMAIYPLALIIPLAFSESSLGMPFQDWVGTENLRASLSSSLVRGSLARSTVFAVVTTAACLVIGTAVALLMATSRRDSRLLRTLLLLPLLTPPIAVGVAWRLLLNAGGPVNTVIQQLGLADGSISFLGTSPWAFPAIMVADIWQWTPLVILLVFAALMGMPDSVREASQVDGASWWQELRYVTLPLILPALAAVAMLKMILAFRLFDLVFIVTRGGPGFDTTTSTYAIFRTALESFDIGSAAAQTLIFVVFVVLITLPFVLLKSWAEDRTG